MQVYLSFKISKSLSCTNHFSLRTTPWAFLMAVHHRSCCMEDHRHWLSRFHLSFSGWRMVILHGCVHTRSFQLQWSPSLLTLCRWGCPPVHRMLTIFQLLKQKIPYYLVFIHSFIHSIIHSRIYKAPLQEIYSQAPPAQPRRHRSVLSNLQNALSLFFSRRRISKGVHSRWREQQWRKCDAAYSCSFSIRHQ